MPKQELQRYKDGSLTLGKLRELLNEIDAPDDAVILVQRIEDTYFENNHWKVYCTRSWHCDNMIRYNENLKNGEFDDVPPDQRMPPFTEEQLDSMDDQYHPAHWICTKRGHDDAVFIEMHY